MAQIDLTAEKPVSAPKINPDEFASIAALFEHAVAEYGDLPALGCFGQEKSFKEFEQQSRSVAAWLQKEKGVKRGDRVALMCPNIFAFPIAMLGIIRAGATQVNVNPLYTPTELAHQLHDSGAETIMVFSGSTNVLAEIIDHTSIKTVITIDLDDATDLHLPSPEVDSRLKNVTSFAQVLKDGAGMTLAPVQLNGSDTLYFQYTGGTTGLSKGAVLSHRNLLANIAQFKAHMPEVHHPGEEIFVAALPLYHIFGLMVMLSYISGGNKTILIPNPRDMDSFVKTLSNSGFTVIAGVNTLFTGLLHHPDFASVDFSKLKATLGGGAPVLKSTSEQWRNITGMNIKEGYGLSETSPILSLNPYDVAEFTETAGLPVADTEIAILRDDDTRAEQGESGEVCARGPQVMRGYWNREEANKEAFTEDGFFRTGDIGLITDEGYLKIVDRKKDMVLVSGFNVYPTEIEAAISHIDGVVECACIGVPNEKTGEAVRVYVVVHPDKKLTAEDIIAHCRNTLTAYKVPKQVEFVVELPKSNVGKILRRELRKLFGA